MAKEHFNAAFLDVVSLEGGVSNHPDDQGGLTKWGISQRAFPDVDILNLTEEECKRIYKEHYWDPLHLDEIQSADVCAELFECGVNQGIGWAAINVQEALNFLGVNVRVDGRLGQATVAAINAYTLKSSDHRRALVIAMNGEEYNRYKQIVKNNPSQIIFTRGWMKRIGLI